MNVKLMVAILVVGASSACFAQEAPKIGTHNRTLASVYPLGRPRPKMDPGPGRPHPKLNYGGEILHPKVPKVVEA
jgi:hypothetical protein